MANALLRLRAEAVPAVLRKVGAVDEGVEVKAKHFEEELAAAHHLTAEAAARLDLLASRTAFGCEDGAQEESRQFVAVDVHQRVVKLDVLQANE